MERRRYYTTLLKASFRVVEVRERANVGPDQATLKPYEQGGDEQKKSRPQRRDLEVILTHFRKELKFFPVCNYSAFVGVSSDSTAVWLTAVMSAPATET